MIQIKISNIKIPVGQQRQLRQRVLQLYPIAEQDIEEFKILRESIDARKKDHIFYLYQVYIKLKEKREDLLKHDNVSLYQAPEPISYPQWKEELPPVVVGFGPAGMFAALYLARCGAKPVIIERGSRIEKRKAEVAEFLQHKKLNPNSNVQFGEGGAGTFSDGKLSTNINDRYISFILEEFYKHGATEDVCYAANPHVGTDYLEKVVRNIREEIISLGGEFHFNTTFEDFSQEGKIIRIKCHNGFSVSSKHVLLCLGHSARDIIKHLYAKGLRMEAKPFSMGVRIEHLQSDINRMQYGKSAKLLPAASYRGVVHLKDRSVYTFCMCPGGVVMASASEDGTIVTNGMSEKKRNKANANSALLVGINPEDYYQSSPLDGLDYQEKYEKLAFEVSGDYRAPANLVGEFLQGKIAKGHRKVKPSYPHGVVYCDLGRCLPAYAVKALREAIPLFDRKLRGFNDADAVLTGIESRSSSPVRILRDEGRQSNIPGLYPVGEGAGYAGGIVSAALDGLKTAMEIVEN